MYVFIILFIMLSILISYNTNIKSSEENIFSLKYTLALKGIAAILIIANHLAYSICDVAYLQEIFERIGSICVVIFFFVSGYGTMYGFLNKKNYFDRFLNNKLLKILIPYIIATIIYFIGEIFLGKSLEIILKDFIQGEPIVKFSWYIIVIMYLYCTFYISFKQKKVNQYILFTFFNIIYFVTTKYIFEWQSNWYNTFIAFFIGVLFQKNYKVLTKNRIKIVLISLGICAYFFKYIYNPNVKYYEYYYWIFLIGISGLIFELSNWIVIESKILNFVNNISLETYLYHGLVISFFRKIDCIYNSNYLYTVCVYLFTFMISYIINYIYKYIINKKIYISTKKPAEN